MNAFWTSVALHDPTFAGLLGCLREAAIPRRLAQGERLFSIGEAPRRMYYVVDGELRLVRNSRVGGETVLQRARRGFLAEASLVSAAYHCDAVAVEASMVLVFPITEFRRLLDGDAAFRAGWTAHLAREVRRLRARCERLSLKGAAARVLHYLEIESDDGETSRIPSRKAWAAELGLTHEALYRTLARLRDRGAIRIDGERIALIAFTDD